MGGYGSGRTGGRPTADASYKIDLPWLARQGWVVEGRNFHGTLTWSSRREAVGSIRYSTLMEKAGSERLELHYTCGPDDARESVTQSVALISTRPNYGGKRWWMICPFSEERVAKLYMPPGGDRFASRKVWQLGYQSQRETRSQRHFSRLFALQDKLGGDVGYDVFINRPKGMWDQTFQRHQDRYFDLHHMCDLEMGAMLEGLTEF